jgi:hypothetical protein
MKVYIDKYRNHWLLPYTIFEKVCFWEKDTDVFYNLENKSNTRYKKVVNMLEPVCVALQKFLDVIHPRINYVKIDKWDTWNMDSTLGTIILPMLNQLKETKHGSPIVDLEDVPESMRYSETEEWDSQTTFEFYNEFDSQKIKCDVHDRWNWVLDEMIFAFQHFLDDSWQDAYRSGEIDWKTVPCAWNETGRATLYTTENGPNHTYQCDYDAIAQVEDRIQNGFRLFGKYYLSLWD